jgi:arsenate reductase-like glutaredoxin family protein
VQDLTALFSLDTCSTCTECQAFRRQLAEREREFESLRKQTIDAAELGELKQSFDSAHIAIFRNWMEHKSTHESGSFHKFVERFRQASR